MEDCGGKIRYQLIKIATMVAGVLGIDLQKVGNVLITLGQKLSASSIPVVLSTEQEAKIDLLAKDLTLIATNAKLDSILIELKDDIFIEHELWVDGSINPDVYYRIERKVSQDDQIVTTVITRLSDNVVVGSLPITAVPVAADTNKKAEFYRYVAIIAGTGYSVDDILSNTLVFDVQSASIISNSWYNLTTSAAISAPLAANIRELLANNAAKETGGNLALIATSVQILDDIVFAEDTPHGSADKGIMALAVRNESKATLTSTELDYSPIAVNKYGEIITASEKPTRFADLGASVTLNVKASLGVVFALSCYNANILPRYLQLHNTATTPAAAAVPLYTFLVPSVGQIIIGTDFFTIDGAEFTTGIAFAFSTTRNTYTAGAAADQSTIMHYL